MDNKLLGFIGLGKMGQNMVRRLLSQNVKVAVWNRSPEKVTEVVKLGAVGAKSVEELVKSLPTPRLVWLMLPQGQIVDEFIDQVSPFLEAGDLLIDGGNSFYKDTLRRATKLSALGIHFMDVGVSGGPAGALNGATLMVGGAKEDYDRVEELLIKLAAPKALAHFGPVGAGHFAKMVHNGIEYGMMQAIAEGTAVLKASQFNYDLGNVFKLYNNRSVIESRLVGWTEEALTEDPELSKISSKISATGEGEWTIQTAQELGVEVPVISDSFKVRQNSTEESENFRDKVVSAQRGKFGGHAVTKNSETK